MHSFELYETGTFDFLREGEILSSADYEGLHVATKY